VRLKTAKKNILVIDDEADIRDLLTYNLEQEGYAVRSLSNGEDALKWCETESVDLILLDLMLPGMTGLEICRRLKRNPKLEPIPIIMISAKSTETDVIVGLELGALYQWLA
jgi:DNA-binding response OmpR family regulator